MNSVDYKNIDSLIIQLGAYHLNIRKDCPYLDLFNKIIQTLATVTVAPEDYAQKQSYLNDCRVALQRLESLSNLKNDIFLENFSFLLEKVIQFYIWTQDVRE